MRTGELRSFITIESPVITKSKTGAATTTWETFRQVYAHIEQLRGYEKQSANATWPGADYKITLRFIAGLLPTYRIVFEDKIFSIFAINDVDMRHREIELVCQQGVKAA